MRRANWHFVTWVVAVVFFAWYILPMFVTPSGVWVRKTVRNNPLTNPIKVSDVTSEGVSLANGRVLRIAGVTFPSDPESQAAALTFVKAATLQGIEISRELPDRKSAMFVCEPRIYHWCGNDRIAAHYEQQSLAELMIVSGHAKFDEQETGLTDSEKRKLLICQSVTDKDTEPWRVSSTQSINQSNMSKMHWAEKIFRNPELFEPAARPTPTLP